MKKVKKPAFMTRIKNVLKGLGPGLVTGAADNDPSGIATYTQVGTLFGYNQLFTAFYSIPFMIAVQVTCGKIGVMTGKGLAGVIRQHYNRPILIVCVLILLVSNIINIGADLNAMASCLELIIPIPYMISLFCIALGTILLQIFVPYRAYAKYLKYLALMMVLYVVTAFFVKQNWHEIMVKTLIPTIEFNKDYLLSIIAILGTTISPYLFFWQAGQEVEEEVADKKITEMGAGLPHPSKKRINKVYLDTAFGMIYSCLIMWFIMITAASTLHLQNLKEIQSAEQAALALKPLLGDFAFILFSLGILVTGLLAVPTLSGSAAYALSETFKWKEGLGKKFKFAPAFYLVIIVATLLGLLTNFLSIPPFQLLYYSAALNGVCSIPLLIMIFLIASNGKIMKKRTNPLVLNVLGWMIIAIIIVASVCLIIYWKKG